MSDESNVEEARAFAREEIERLLGLDEPDACALFELAQEVLGERRAARCLALVRDARLTRRADATSKVAALIFGTRQLGDEWWERVGDALAAAHGEGALDTLAARVCDDCANERWGEPIAEVDLNSPRGVDRVELPAGAQPGDVFVAWWDPGCRVVVEVVDRDGVIGSLLGERRVCDTADVDWAWGMASGAAPVRLPGEVAGTGSDPFAAALDPAVARRLRAWAGEHEADSDLLGPPWVTRGDLWEARIRLGLPYTRTAEWYPFEIVAVAAVDGDDEALAYALARLEMN